ncbi:MAG: hypothetical protein VR69_02375 [Peptococcaceae bacterium BRH_c4b]|nr:MAG: hypothetical protein VR69_02375 [Peptococcaceae bacterium BRH_c4b]
MSYMRAVDVLPEELIDKIKTTLTVNTFIFQGKQAIERPGVKKLKAKRKLLLETWKYTKNSQKEYP